MPRRAGHRPRLGQLAAPLLLFALGCGSGAGGSGNPGADTDTPPPAPVANTGGGAGTGAATGGRSGAAGSGGVPGTGGAQDAGGAASGGTSGTTTDPYAAARQACVDKINALRATEGKPAYLRWTEAEACSDGEAKSDSVSKKAHGAFGTCKESAQDECPSWPNDPNKIVTDCLQDMWNEGPGDFATHGHYLNMSNTKYKYVACGFFSTPDNKMWAVQNFK